MNKTQLVIAASLGFVFMTSSSVFSADLSKRKTVPVPVSKPMKLVNNSWQPYFGVSAGNRISSNYTVGAKLGVEKNWFRTEVAYDYLQNDKHLVTGMGYVQHQIGRFKPYLGAGLGREFTSVSGVKDRNVYILSTGSKVSLTNNWELDAQYRYINGFTQVQPYHVTTLGVNYKF